ncbi:uncharacterized protein LOC108606103 [Drosophila busckii]|uniref:uncharacterized protein LOC108606103 n=1 Tax=Drosophila busckii TaxID=30019 RepID=UPI00083EAD02|nr:uncharacterized protein LOC108606103 [Drosophila busckii]
MIENAIFVVHTDVAVDAAPRLRACSRLSPSSCCSTFVCCLSQSSEFNERVGLHTRYLSTTVGSTSWRVTGVNWTKDCNFICGSTSLIVTGVNWTKDYNIISISASSNNNSS